MARPLPPPPPPMPPRPSAARVSAAAALPPSPLSVTRPTPDSRVRCCAAAAAAAASAATVGGACCRSAAATAGVATPPVTAVGGGHAAADDTVGNRRPNGRGRPWRGRRQTPPPRPSPARASAAGTATHASPPRQRWAWAVSPRRSAAAASEKHNGGVCRGGWGGEPHDGTRSRKRGGRGGARAAVGWSRAERSGDWGATQQRRSGVASAAAGHRHWERLGQRGSCGVGVGYEGQGRTEEPSFSSRASAIGLHSSKC